MNQAAQKDARRLTELLLQQRDVYRRLLELSESQHAAVGCDEPESLLRVLGQRQQLIAQLTEINTLLEPYRSRWDELREGLSPAQRLEVSELVEQVQALLGQILQQDETDSRALQRRTEEVRQEAAAASTGRRVHNAYAAQSYGAGTAPRYIDRRDGEERCA